MQKRSVINSPRLTELRRKKRKILKIKITAVGFGLLVLFFGFALIARISSINIKTVTVSGNLIVESRDIKNIIEKNLTGNYLWIFPKTNFLIYPKNKIKNELAEKFRRLKEINFNILDSKSLEVSVSEYEGKYLWCGENASIAENKTEQECYFLDNDGYLFDQAPFFSGEVYFKFYGSIIDSKNNPIGAYFLPKDFKQIILLKQNLEQIKLKLVSFWWNEDKGEGEYTLSGSQTSVPKIILKMNSNYQKLAENLQAALETEPLKTDFQNKYSSLLYLDLRFGNKVVYKFK